jgi:hypothetical protein
MASIIKRTYPTGKISYQVRCTWLSEGKRMHFCKSFVTYEEAETWLNERYLYHKINKRRRSHGINNY